MDAVESRIHVRCTSFTVNIASRHRRACSNLTKLSELPLMAHVWTLNELIKEVSLQARVHLVDTTVGSVARLGYISLVAVDELVVLLLQAVRVVRAARSVSRLSCRSHDVGTTFKTVVHILELDSVEILRAVSAV